MRSAAAVLSLVCLLLPTAVVAGGPQPSPTASPATSKWVTLLASPAVRQPTGIAIDRRGNPAAPKWAYTADAATGRIVKFGTNGKVLGSWPYCSPEPCGGPAAVAVGGSGNVFVAVPEAGTVAKYTPGGTRLATWTGFAQPGGIAVAPNGNVYVAETGAHRVLELSSAGMRLMYWDTEVGVPQEYVIGHVSSGGLGTPTAVAWLRPDSLWIGTRCLVGQTCKYSSEVQPQPDQVDALLTFRVTGPDRGLLGDWWYGLGHAADGTPQEVPYKESEPFVTVDALASDLSGSGYVAGMMWQRGGQKQRAVLAYTPLGYKWGYWPLPSQARVAGIAVDTHGGIYVAQGNRILKLQRPLH